MYTGERRCSLSYTPPSPVPFPPIFPLYYCNVFVKCTGRENVYGFGLKIRCSVDMDMGFAVDMGEKKNVF
jgi:hypothetical protein